MHGFKAWRAISLILQWIIIIKKNSAVKNFKNKISKKKNAINYVTNNMK